MTGAMVTWFNTCICLIFSLSDPTLIFAEQDDTAVSRYDTVCFYLKNGVCTFVRVCVYVHAVN